MPLALAGPPLADPIPLNRGIVLELEQNRTFFKGLEASTSLGFGQIQWLDVLSMKPGGERTGS